MKKDVSTENDERRRTEDAVRSAHAELEQIFNAAPPMAVLGLDHTVLKVNANCAKLFGTPPEQLVGKKCIEVLHGSACCTEDCGLKAVRRGESLKTEQTKHVANGRVLPCLVQSLPYRNSDGEVVGAIQSITDISSIKNAEQVILQATARNITAQKRAEDELRESRDRFERVAKSVSDVIYEWDVASNRIDWQGDIDAELGYPQGTIPPTIDGWLALIHRDDRERVAAAVEHHRQNSEPIDITYRIRRRNGEWRHWEDRGSPVLNDAGVPTRVIGACSDVTERMRAENALRESEQRFMDVLYAADDAILLIDAETYVDCNDATAQMLGYENRDEFLMTHPSELSPPQQPDGRDSFEKAEEMMRTALDKGFHRFEWIHRKADGTDFPVEVSLTPITYQGKTILHCVWRDLTEQKMAEEELMSSERKLRTITDSALDAVIMMDPDGNVAHWNPAAEEILGYSSEEMMGRPVHDVLTPAQYRQTASQGFAHFAASGKGAAVGKTLELTALRKDGTEFPIDISVNAIEQNDGWWAVAVLRDITDRKRDEQERSRLQERLVETSRLAGMSEVATGVLHNVGNVLNSVNVSANIVSEKLRKSRIGSLAKVAAMLNEHADHLPDFLTIDPRGRQLPTYLSTLAAHLSGEKDVLLDEMSGLLQRVEHVKEIVSMQQEHSHIAGVKEEVDLADVLDGAIKLNDASFVRHNVQIVREFDDVAPMVLDKHRLLQILVNLIGNAKHALHESQQDDKRVVLRITNNQEGRVSIEVVDNGVGIPKEHLTRIFEHGFTTKKDGHGFGLHSSALAAKELGGTLTAYSDGPGCGACFCLELPQYVEEMALCKA